MLIDTAERLSSKLRPCCPRDNRSMKRQFGRSRTNQGDFDSYYCGHDGCSVRYSAAEGYFTLMGTPGQTYGVEEPGVNALKCPRHHSWLYRRQSSDAEAGVRWSCGVEGCDYSYDAKSKGDWVRA